MKNVCIGIHVHSEPQGLRATLKSLRANTSVAYDLLLLPDGPDHATKSTLHELSDLTQSATDEPQGAAACFNRLASNCDAELVVLLESGSLAGPRWLELLLAAFDADPRAGLAGPSTNVAWNEQCLFPNSRGDAAAIERNAQEALTRFGNQTRTLEPLYSLSDFCYAVKREVIDAIGAADESYGLGPCWEMDYNIRAMRAGFRGVWVCAAYVHRSGFTARRSQEEARRFETSKKLYQDKFCGARLRGEKTDYRAHCRGDACPNFAPPNLIRLHHTLAAINTEEVVDDCKTEPTAVTASDPLVSCIMPTCNRRSFVTQAIRRFLRQDYVNSELVIVDDGSDRIADCVTDDARVRYIALDRKLNVGAKRNLACREARGEIIAHWDDDDWYPASRLRTQVRSLVERRAEVCGSSSIFFLDATADRAFEYRYAGRPWVAGSTLVYRKSFWERNNFQEIQVGEDAQFLWSGATPDICDLGDSALCVAMIHPANTSRKETGGAFWTSQPIDRIRQFLGDDLNFYRAMLDGPLISAIMPTRNRRSFVRLTLPRFLQQDYPNKELVIVDDGDDAVGDLVSDIPAVKYTHLVARTSIGAKRNLACEQAAGEIIAHWDDDDWYAADRLRYQSAPIVAGEADITGLENAFVLDLPEGKFWTTKPQLHQKMFVGNVHGGTLVYRKQLLSDGLRYPNANLAEDAWLLHYALQRGNRLLRLANAGVFVYMRHGGNAWRECTPGRFLDPAGWQRIDPPPGLPSSIITTYREAQASRTGPAQ